MPVDLDAAEQFLAANGRVLERRRFGRLFRHGPSGPVRHAVAAFQNEDGGFGHALEPDGRGPESQPAAVLTALSILDEAQAWDEGVVGAACDWLAAIEPQAGGTPFVVPGVERWPHGPWWRPQPGLPPSLTTTGQVLGPLLDHEVEHPWVQRATAWLWSAVDDPGEIDPYDARGLMTFLDHVPDRARAEAAAEQLAETIHRVLQPRPGGPADEHRPLDLALHPGSVGRRIFDPAAIDADLDHLAAGQQDDGGWTFTWLAWSAVAEAEWRGVVTVEALKVLRENGRL